MKRLFSLFVLCVLYLAACAQNKPIFLFDQFPNAKVYFKNRTTTTAPMNYDAVNNIMYFKQGNEVMELTNINIIDSIVWPGSRKFIVHGSELLEEIKMEHGTAYIQWRIKNVNVGSKGALGATTQAKVETIGLKSMGIYSTDEEPQSADVYQQKNDNDYYIPLNEKLQKVKSLKQIEKLFPIHKETIASYAKDNKINMKEAQDVLQLLNYCLQLSKEKP